MKRDMDLVREILLKIADAEDTDISLSDIVSENEDEKYKLAAYHMQMLIEEAGFVRGIDLCDGDEIDWTGLALTWHGHDFLESIRDPTVWEQTKQSARKAGSFSIDVLGALAKAYAKAKLKQLTGLDV